MNKNIFREFSQQGRQILLYGADREEKMNTALENLSKLSEKYGTSFIKASVTRFSTVEDFTVDLFNKIHVQNLDLINGFTILEEELFKQNTVLVIDGMEEINNNIALREKLAELAKSMSDNSIYYENSYAKVIFIGTVNTAELLWNDVQSLKSRMATISI
ncbi:hypothetical protein EGT49_08060 [Companilactobacillus suantsaicola]|uniref:ATPase AAA-type core domain-containing protein n=1 Tax=Companilactobacillus suantsaicola TaxID=2487723 RepID=A0A4Z0JIN7_9LACO|nr:hypothetical protein [Companilactobacillus suantsaicola]TGD22725.1 hypothetical protein EGT49_08060 [Companilactobacillus suantsaicola]